MATMRVALGRFKAVVYVRVYIDAGSRGWEPAGGQKLGG
jgi:hypothetical protein